MQGPTALWARCKSSPGAQIRASPNARALAIDPNFASAHAWIGLAKYFTGRNEETEAHILEALRISPRDTYAFFWMLIVGFAKLGAGCDEDAVA
jgi:hypothetical protein